jgi:hypothetical protein
MNAMSHPDLQRHVGRYYGKYAGIVTANTDDEMRGRIKVKVVSVFGADVEVEARPCFPFGHFFVPDVGAHVWVEFEAGSPRHPLYTGYWYPDGSVPAEAAIDPPANRVIRMPSGHTIELQDKDGEQKVVIRHKDNAFVTLDKDGSVLVSNKHGSHLYLNAKDGEATLTEEHGNFVRMSGDGVTIVNASGTVLELKGGALKVIAAAAVTITAKDVNVESSTVNLGQRAGLSGERVLLGEAFMNAFLTHTHPTALGPSGPPIPVPPLLLPPIPNVPHLLLSSGVKVAKP